MNLEDKHKSKKKKSYPILTLRNRQSVLRAKSGKILNHMRDLEKVLWLKYSLGWNLKDWQTLAMQKLSGKCTPN